MTDRFVTLHSTDGQRLLREAKTVGCCQPWLGKIFDSQKGCTTCGIQTAALLMSAAHLGRQRPVAPPDDGTPYQPPFTEENLFDFPATVAAVVRERVRHHGCSLAEVCDIFTGHGCRVQLHQAADSSVDAFRVEARAALQDATSARGVFVNYERSGERGGGHHSPLGAYHPGEDRFLIWDTGKGRDVGWEKTKDLFDTMNTLDKSNHSSRGFAVVNCIAVKVEE